MDRPDKCKNCQWYGKPYWSIINPCDNCPMENVDRFTDWIDPNVKELKEENEKLKKELDNVNITKDNYIKLINKVTELTERIDDTNKWVQDLKNNLNSSLLGHKEYRDYIIDILDEISKRLKGSEE